MACTAGGQVVRLLRPRQAAALVHRPNTGIGPISRIDDNNGKTPIQQTPRPVSLERQGPRRSRPCEVPGARAVGRRSEMMSKALAGSMRKRSDIISRCMLMRASTCRSLHEDCSYIGVKLQDSDLPP
jgi:hypothetical protein